ncbi:PepSY domain-containing protein [Lachnospiraceae bacterium 56-18]
MKFYKLCSAKLMKRNTAAAMILAAIAGSLAGCGRIADIGKDKAADIALEDASLSESDVTRLRISKDTDNGKGIYEVEFTMNTTEYEYEILASNGDILSADFKELQGSSDPQPQGSDDPQPQGSNDPQPQRSDSHDSSNHGAVPQADVQISSEQASKLALDRVPGATEQDLKIELDYDDGYYKYEGDIIYDQKEYEFEIDANTGDFLEWKEERH